MLGLPWSGVTTTLRCLAGSAVAADAGQGVADVRDPRLAELARVSKSKRVVAATLEVADLTKLVRGAKRGEGLGNELLAHMRTTDALLLVVRCFTDEQVPHSEGRVDPVDDAETVELELVFADQAVVERRLQRVAKTAKSGDKTAVAEREQLERLAAALEEGRPARALGEQLPDALDLLTAKPALYVANVDESGNADSVERLRAFGAERGIQTIALNAKLEAEIAELDSADRQAFLDDLGIEQAALDLVSLAAYAALDLIPFFTSGEKETRAWTIRRGQNAQEAAGKIHTDLARGFIRAEVIEWDKLVEAGGEAEAKRRGWLRVEGRDYVVKDGDVLNVRFNV
ncbi:MAG: ribosome-binding ATPase [Gaiellales bacterium]|jgi:GTP-binding protein YchF|nr:ribosome-binding ATPase [Gaiellales bacterium]